MKFVIGILLFLTTAAAFADDELPPIVRAGLDAYDAKGAEEAWRVWGLEGSQKGIGQKGDVAEDDKAKFIAALSDAANIYGKPLGYELIRRFEVSPSYQTVHVLWRFERRPLFCMFVCYRAKDAWKVLNFFVGSDPREYLPESVSGMQRNPR